MRVWSPGTLNYSKHVLYIVDVRRILRAPVYVSSTGGTLQNNKNMLVLRVQCGIGIGINLGCFLLFLLGVNSAHDNIASMHVDSPGALTNLEHLNSRCQTHASRAGVCLKH